jgi:beta-lactamase class A
VVAAVGIDAVNRVVGELGLTGTALVSDLMTMLNEMAVEVGFSDFAALEAYEPTPDGPSDDEIRQGLAVSAALDPARGSRTTARDCVELVRAIWQDRAAPPEACAGVRRAMAHQLTRHRIAHGFAPPVSVSAKSGGLMGVVRNEVGLVAFPDGASYAVAVCTRTDPAVRADARKVDDAIGEVAARAVEQLHG